MTLARSTALGFIASLSLAIGGAATAVPSAPDPSGPEPAKLDSSLAALVAGEGDQARRPSTLQQATPARVNADGEVLVDVYVDGSLTTAEDDLAALGMDVVAVSDIEPQRLVEGWIPVDALLPATGIDQTTAFVPVVALNDEGSVLAEGDAVHNGPAARSRGADGSGVKVGVISDSIDRVNGGIADSQATGDLPGPASSPPGSVTVLTDGDPGDSDEGRAMAEIIFDGAPGVREFYFGTGLGAAVKIDAIDRMLAEGVDVIADDIALLTEPFFQDGAVSTRVNEAADDGVVYLASAGNRARNSWEGRYTPIPDPRGVSATANDFDPSVVADSIQTIGTFTNRSIFYGLQWDEAWGSAITDFAVDVWDLSGPTPAYLFSADTANIGGLPLEIGGVSCSCTFTFGLSFRRVAGTGTPLLKTIFNGAGAFTIAEHATNSPAINPGAASAAKSLAVAATNFATPTEPEDFSSRGPVTRLLNANGVRLANPQVRQKPDLAAADGVSTTVPGFTTFFGTSAATPTAAAIVALVRSANPRLSSAQVRQIMTNPANARDCSSAPGQPDTDCGAGFILADRAVHDADDSAPVVNSSRQPAKPNKRGWFTKKGAVRVSFAVSDAQSPVTAQTGCGATSVRSSGVTKVRCRATSSGGTTVRTVTVKRDTSKPKKLQARGLEKSYRRGTFPTKKSVKCRAKDPHSGIRKCRIKGLTKKRGTHTLRVIAINKAGLKATKKFRYRIR